MSPEQCPKGPDYAESECKVAKEKESPEVREARIKQSLLDFVKKLREGKADDYGYTQIVEKLFQKKEERKCSDQLMNWRDCLDLDKQHEIAQAVLKETKLTKEEAKRLCDEATARNKKRYEEDEGNMLHELEKKMEK